MRKEVTNVFLIEDNKVCLGMKKRGFGAGLWNGTGGKINEGESSEEAAKREAKEEFGVSLTKLEDNGNVLFVFKDGLEVDCDIYLCREWKGQLEESEEMRPEWFEINKLPIESMWETDRTWLPLVLDGKKIRAVYHFNDDAKTIERFELEEI